MKGTEWIRAHPNGISYAYGFKYTLGGWVFVADLTRGSVGKFIPMGRGRGEA